MTGKSYPVKMNQDVYLNLYSATVALATLGEEPVAKLALWFVATHLGA